MNKTTHLNLFCNKIAFNKTVWTIKCMILTGVLFSYQISNYSMICCSFSPDVSVKSISVLPIFVFNPLKTI